MGIIRRIKNYFEKYEIEQREEEAREQELVKQIEHIRNINIFSAKKIPKVSTIDRINTNNLVVNQDLNQLKKTYLFIKKNIEEAENRNLPNDIIKLTEMKKEVKRLMLEKSDNLDFDSIKINILFGNINKLDYYYDYLTRCYKQYENIKYDTEVQQIMITIRTLQKLINIKKEKINDKKELNVTKKKKLNFQFVKKVA